MVTGGCAGPGVALPTVYRRVSHQRCWVHRMRNICDGVRRRDHDQVKQEAQRIYQAASLAEVRGAFLRVKCNRQRIYPGMVRWLEKDLPGLLTFFRFPRHLWRKPRTTDVIERCFVGVESVDRIIHAIFKGLNDQRCNCTLRISTQAA